MTGGAETSIINNRRGVNTPYIQNDDADLHKRSTEGKYPKPPSENSKRLTNNELIKYKNTPAAVNAAAGVDTRYDEGATQPDFKFELYNKPEKSKVPTKDVSGYVSSLWKDSGYDKNAFRLLQQTQAASDAGKFEMPVQHVYNINLPGPTGGHVEMNKVYENFLPKRESHLTFVSIGERLTTIDYTRQILIKSNDGEEISIDNDRQNNLLSYIKFLELNPTFYSPFTSNPYDGLPYGLLVYRSCFPIRLSGGRVICAKDSIGLNIRLYSLSFAEYCSYKLMQPVRMKYDVWRELSFYEYIRNNIVKARQCPHFVSLFTYFFCPNKKIDFFSLKKNCITQKQKLTHDYQRFLQIHSYVKGGNFNNKIPDSQKAKVTDLLGDNIAKLPDEVDPFWQAYSGNTLIVVTESPNTNIYQWSSRKYKSEGIVQKMVRHGYHTEDVWFSILFQIMSALHAMQVHGIYLREMTMQDNIFIKDLKIYGNSVNHWRYVIDGISYYIPNYGYIVLVDSNYKDIIPNVTITKKCDRLYKCYGCDISGDSFDIDDCRKGVYQNYKKIMNSNSFTGEYVKNDVFKPPERVMAMLEAMTVDTEEDLGVVILKYFQNFMHNRIGTHLKKDTEVPNIREQSGLPKRGDMVVEVVGDEDFRWATVVDVGTDGNMNILSKEETDDDYFVDKLVNINSVKAYPRTEHITQISTATANLSSGGLLDTYTISSE